jgi:hypothetical protein
VDKPVTIRVPIVTSQLANRFVEQGHKQGARFVLRYPPPLFDLVTLFSATVGYDGSASKCWDIFSDANGVGSFLPAPGDDLCDGFLGFPHMPITNPAGNISAVSCPFNDDPANAIIPSYGGTN